MIRILDVPLVVVFMFSSLLSCTSADSSKDLIWVQKSDGSLQCGMGDAKSLAEGEKELKEAGATPRASEKRNDGKMRIQLCGSPTGDMNAFKIESGDLPKASSKGYKKVLEEK